MTQLTLLAVCCAISLPLQVWSLSLKMASAPESRTCELPRWRTEHLNEQSLLGRSVAIKEGTVLLGDPRADSGRGAVYVADPNGYPLYILMSPTPTSGPGFGWAVAVDRGVIVVGAHGWDGDWRSSAYLFNAAAGQQMFQLSAPDDVVESGSFGFSVAIDEGIVVIGVQVWAPLDGQAFGGQACLFDIFGRHHKTLNYSEPSLTRITASVVAVDDGIVAMSGASWAPSAYSGPVYIFNFSTEGEELKKIDVPQGVELLDGFGSSIAVEAGIIAIGAPGRNTVFIFSPDGNLTFGRDAPSFGESLAMHGEMIAVGARGNAYIFDTFGREIKKMASQDSDSDPQIHFGSSVAIDRGNVVVGKSTSDSRSTVGGRGGSVYMTNTGRTC